MPPSPRRNDDAKQKQKGDVVFTFDLPEVTQKSPKSDLLLTPRTSSSTSYTYSHPVSLLPQRRSTADKKPERDIQVTIKVEGSVTIYSDPLSSDLLLKNLFAISSKSPPPPATSMREQPADLSTSSCKKSCSADGWHNVAKERSSDPINPPPEYKNIAIPSGEAAGTDDDEQSSKKSADDKMAKQKRFEALRRIARVRRGLPHRASIDGSDKSNASQDAPGDGHLLDNIRDDEESSCDKISSEFIPLAVLQRHESLSKPAAQAQSKAKYSLV